jgi:hypothetical protein
LAGSLRSGYFTGKLRLRGNADTTHVIDARGGHSRGGGPVCIVRETIPSNGRKKNPTNIAIFLRQRRREEYAEQ